MAPLRYAAKFDPFLSLDCAPHPPHWHNPRKGRDQILTSGNLGQEREVNECTERPPSAAEASTATAATESTATAW